MCVVSSVFIFHAFPHFIAHYTVFDEFTFAGTEKFPVCICVTMFSFSFHFILSFFFLFYSLSIVLHDVLRAHETHVGGCYCHFRQHQLSHLVIRQFNDFKCHGYGQVMENIY